MLAGPSSATPLAIVAADNKASKKAALPSRQKPDKPVLKQAAAILQPLEAQKEPAAPALQVSQIQVEAPMRSKDLHRTFAAHHYTRAYSSYLFPVSRERECSLAIPVLTSLEYETL